MEENPLYPGAVIIKPDSIESIIYEIVSEYDCYIWKSFNKKHRLNGPAVIIPEIGIQEFWVNGQRIEDWCRENGIEILEASDEDWFLIGMRFGIPSIDDYNGVILPLIRNIYPTIIARGLVGVQPMSGPTGLIHSLRAKYGDSK